MFNHIIRCTPSCFTTNSLSSVTEALVQELYSSRTEYMSYDLWFISLIYHFVSDRNKHQYSSKLHLFSFSSQIIFSWPSWDNLFLASNKMGPYFKSVLLFPSSPASYPLSLQQDLAYQWRISSFNKSLSLSFQPDLWTSHSFSSPGSLVYVCGRGCSAEWTLVRRWQKTCLVTTGFGNVCSSMCGWWCVRTYMCTGTRWRWMVYFYMREGENV